MKCILFALLLVHSAAFAQHISILDSGTHISIRGLSVVNDRVVWVSGTHGTVGKSLDSGRTWKWIHIKGFENTDFRDIEAFDESIAVAMGVDTPAYIVRTIDGGANW